MAQKNKILSITNELNQLKKDSLFREVPPIDRGAEKELIFNGKKYLNLASNDYLGLASSEILKKAATKGIKKYGVGVAASRLVTGNFTEYLELERQFAKFIGKDDSIVFSSGYAANLAIMDSFATKSSVVFSDKLNHASIIDGIKISGAKQVRYNHNDLDHLKKRIEKFKDVSDKILITDTIFSMDGDFALLSELAEICDFYDIFFIVDEAHAEGILGQGRGLGAELKIADKIDLHMGAFSKGFGSMGGVVAGDKDCISYLRNKGRSFIFSTGLVPAAVCSSLAALNFVKDDFSNGGKLASNLLHLSSELRDYLNDLGFDTLNSKSQIIPVVLKDSDITLRAKDFLLRKGVYTAAIRVPTVPPNSARLRLSLRADLTRNDMVLIKEAFKALKRDFLND